ncbi:MAG: peptidase T [Candidatus Neomarinimicrobiota bacterium]|nr:MAG: peptidase T [Candidatus Neomarinimicrobiota bacterium]
MRKDLLDRFFRYVKIDTQSQEDVEDRYPSTEKQKVLSELLVKELKELGLEDAEMDEYGYVMATLPSNLSDEKTSKVPVIGFLAHVDTSPEVSGKDVKPILHENYRGGDIVLPGDKTQIIKVKDNPELKNNIGNDIITSDGTTLLGADNKAGIAEIVTMIDFLKQHPDIPHGIIRVGFTPDEEVGNGTKYFDVKKFGADFAYTVDGEKLGEIENETFNAALASFKVTGINVHPGYAKGRLVNALRIIADIIKELGNDPAPETTEKREGYLHPYVLDGGVGSANLKILIRDFEMEGIETKSKRLKEIQKKIAAKYPKAKIDLDIKEQYKNMRFKLEEDLRTVEYALEAVKRTGIEPKLQIIRGGTDGAKLCYKGLLTPNIFTGGMNFHSKLEWIPLQAMEKAVETLVNLVQIWAEKSLDS